MNIDGLKSYSKDSPVCLDSEYYQSKNKTEKLLFRYLGVIFPFFLNDAVNSSLKNASLIHLQIRGEKTQRQHDSLKTKFRMKWVVLPYSEPYTEETKFNEHKIYSFSCNQEYY